MTSSASSASARRRQVAGRVGVRERAAERAAVADLRVGHGRRSPRPAARRAARPAGRAARRSAWSSRRSRARRRPRGCRAARRSGRGRPARGAASRSRSTGSRLCPPASTLASSPASASARTASSTVVGRDVVERRRDHWTSSLRVVRVDRAEAGTPASAVSTGGLLRWRRPCAVLDGPPHPLRRARHLDVVDAEVADRVDDGVDHRRGGRDRAGLADALDAQRVRGRRGLRAVGGEATAGRRRDGHQVVDEACR